MVWGKGRNSLLWSVYTWMIQWPCQSTRVHPKCRKKLYLILISLSQPSSCLQNRSTVFQSKALPMCRQLPQKPRACFVVDLDLLGQNHFKEGAHFWKESAGQSCPSGIRVSPSTFAEGLKGPWFLLRCSFFILRWMQRVGAEDVVLVTTGEWQGEPSHPCWVSSRQPLEGQLWREWKQELLVRCGLEETTREKRRGGVGGEERKKNWEMRRLPEISCEGTDCKQV